MRFHRSPSTLVGPSPVGDRGASFTEYGALILVIAVVTAVVVTASIPDQVKGLYSAAICELGNLGQSKPDDCGDSTTSQADGGESDDQSDRPSPPDGNDRDVPPEAREPDDQSTWPRTAPPTNERTEGTDPAPVTSGDVPKEESPLYEDPGAYPQMEEVEQSNNDYESLGKGKSGWCAPWDDLCCPENEATGQDTCDTIDEVELAINASRSACHAPGWLPKVPDEGQWAYCRPNAADYFEHFLNGSGKDMNVDMNTFLRDVPEFQKEIEQRQDQLIETAIKDAKERGIDGPITYPISTEKQGWGYPPGATNGKDFVYENPDWKNAIGSFHYWLDGEITVYPPEEPGGEPTYELDTNVHMEKWYDWERDNHSPVFAGRRT